MKFGIIVCFRCKNAKIVNLSFKTTKCINCGKILNLDKLKIFFKDDSQHKLREILGAFNKDKNNIS